MINKMDICDFIKEHSDDKDAVLVDVRDKTLYEFGSVPGAVNIPIAHPSRPKVLTTGTPRTYSTASLFMSASAF